MKSGLTLLRYAVAGMLLLLAAICAVAQQPAASSQTPALLEIVYTNCQADCLSETTRIFANGSYVSEAMLYEKAKSGRNRKVLIRAEKQLEADELAELLSWAEQPDFLNAQPEYPVMVVTDYQDWITIIYRNNGQEKRVKVNNFSRGSTSQKNKVPPSVVKLARWAQPQSFQ
jgi:hypothetical protein